jgi:hypothetical protein
VAFISDAAGVIWRIDAKVGGYVDQDGKPASLPGTPPLEKWPSIDMKWWHDKY